jgi:phytoene dehydrogenase-like protein
MREDFDVVVIGAGAGGLLTAARLAHGGLRVLVAERYDRVGGRASTRDLDGFKVNVGAIAIEVDGITQQTFEEVGAEFDVRVPKPPILYRIKGRDVDVTGGGWGLLISKLTRQGAKLLSGLGAARDDSGLPEQESSRRACSSPTLRARAPSRSSASTRRARSGSGARSAAGSRTSAARCGSRQRSQASNLRTAASGA